MRVVFAGATSLLVALVGCSPDAINTASKASTAPAAPAGPVPSAGQQCLDSFKMELKDPESGRVITFEDPLLVYTATNGYGARIQSKALCWKIGDKWQRNKLAELNQVTGLAADTMEAFNECYVQAGSSRKRCAGESKALQSGLRGDALGNAVMNEAREKLGYL